MLNVQKFLLDQKELGCTNAQAFESLIEQYAIKVKHYEDERIVLLDYHMIDSPKMHPIVIECRSLILQFDTFGVVSRKFDRFFNYGEALEYYHDFEPSRSVVMEKADGSLVGVYSCNGKWRISTRGMAFAEGEHVLGGTFKDKVLDTFGLSEDDFQGFFSAYNPRMTFVFEYTSPENRVVTRYENPEMVLLGVNDGEVEYPYDTMALDLNVRGLNFRKVKMYHVQEMQAIVELANSLPNLEEGFVIYDPLSNKRMKVKSSLYVVAHSIRGNDPLPTRKNLLKLIFTGEIDEFLSYFPEWKDKARMVEDEVTDVMDSLAQAWDRCKDFDSQKDFAISIKNVKHNSVLFQCRKLKQDITSVWQGIPIEKKISMFDHN